MLKQAYKFIIPLFFIAIAVISGCHSEKQKVNKTVLSIGINPDYPPFESHQNGKLIGFDVDLMYAIAKELGISLQFYEMSFPSLIGALQTGKIDAVISSIAITPERLKKIDFSDPYYQSSLAIIYHKDKPSPNLHQLKGAKIGALLGSTMEKWLKNNVSPSANIEIVQLDTNGPLVEKLKLGQIDYLLVETLQAIEYIKINPNLAYTQVGTAPDGYGIAMAKNSPLLEKINQAIHTLQQNGTLDNLKHKWLEKN